MITILPDSAEDSSSVTCFDIETAPLPDDELRALLPEFEPPPPPGDFDESTVKLGNLKDKGKIAEKIEAARKAHAEEVAGYEQKVEQAKADHFAKFKQRAALSATTGRVIVIGYLDRVATQIFSPQAGFYEGTLIQHFWDFVAMYPGPLIGFNIFGFDLPFLVRRSWILGVPVPPCVFAGDGKWRSWNTSLFIDVAAEWTFRNRTEFISLDELGRAMGLGGKADGEVTGENFYEYWLSEEEPKHALALEYIYRDLDLPIKIAERMGLI